jgi:phosphoglycolate phosphatase (TIGR01487 family)
VRVRAIITDVDGTMTDGYPVIDLEAASVLRNLERMGFRVLLASGRSVFELYSLSMFLGLCKVVVGENGAVIINGSPADTRILADNFAPLQALAYLKKNLQAIKQKSTLPRYTEVVLERSPDVGTVREAITRSDIPVKVLDSGYAYHIVNSHVEKSLGVREALRLLGIELRESVAIGDSETDVSLFRDCGFGIAVGNCDEPARSAAGFVTKAPGGQGLVEAVTYTLEKLIE